LEAEVTGLELRLPADEPIELRLRKIHTRIEGVRVRLRKAVRDRQLAASFRRRLQELDDRVRAVRSGGHRSKSDEEIHRDIGPTFRYGDDI
jgi:hypothetical protein